MRSYAPICSSTTSTMFSEQFFRQSYTGRDMKIKRKKLTCRSTRYKLTASEAIGIIAFLCNDRYTGVSSGQFSGVMCHFCVCFKILKQNAKSVVKLGIGRLVINRNNPSSLTC